MSHKIPFGPTYDEMLHPEKIAQAVREQALKQGLVAVHDPFDQGRVLRGSVKVDVGHVGLLFYKVTG